MPVFIFFQELSNKKKIKALQPKMTKIASSWTVTTLMLLCTRVPKLHVPAAKLWKELVLDVHEASHLSPR